MFQYLFTMVDDDLSIYLSIYLCVYVLNISDRAYVYLN